MQGDAPTRQYQIGSETLRALWRFNPIHTCLTMFSGIWALRSIDSSIRRQVDIPIHAAVIFLRRFSTLPEPNP